MWKTQLEINVNHCHENDFIRHIYKSLWPYIGCNIITFYYCCPSYLELLISFIYKNVLSRKLKKNNISKTLQINIVKSDNNDTYWMDLSEWFVLNDFMTWKCHGWDCECLVQFSSVVQLSLTLCSPMDCSMPGFPVHHQHLELAQTHVHESVMPSNYLILCHHLLFPSSIFPHIRVFSNESVLRIRWPKYWSFSFSIGSSNEYSGLILFKMDWLGLLVVQGTLKSLLQHHSSKASVLQSSAFFTVPLSHPCMTTGKTIALTRWTFVDKVMSLLFNMLSRLVIAFLPRS